MAEGGVLDLSALEPAPLKVKLPDGQLYDVAEPSRLGALGLQRFVSRYRRSQELMSSTTVSESDLEEMLELLVDCAQVAVPAADRELLGSLDLPQLQRLIDAFSDASPNVAAGEASTSAS